MNHLIVQNLFSNMNNTDFNEPPYEDYDEIDINYIFDISDL